MYIYRRRVPVAVVCTLISGNFRIAYANETEQASIVATPARDGVEFQVDEAAAPPRPP